MGYGGGRMGGGRVGGGRHFGGGRRMGGGPRMGGRMGFRANRLGMRRARLGYHRVGFHSRMLFRRRHHHLLYRTYFRGRRLRHYWGPRLGYYPVPWYETPEFTQQVQTAGVPQVRTRQLQVTLIPYGATNAIMPGGVGPGGIFQFSHPGSTQRYLIAGPANAAAGLSVELMIPPAHIPAAADRVDVLTNLTNTTTATQHTIDTDGDGVPDASPFIPGQDGYITVMAQQGASDALQVYVPATSLLSLKHVVDAIDSWGENSLAARTENANVVDTDFNVDLVQVGPEGKGPRWEHEKFVDNSIPTAPRIVTVGVPPNCNPGSIFTVGIEITGAAEPLQVRVPDGVQPGQPLEIMVPEDASVPAAQQQVSTSDVPDPNAWAAPPGLDFYAEAQECNFQLTVGVLEVTVQAPTVTTVGSVGGDGRACCRVVCIIFFILIFLAIVIGLAVGLTRAAGRAGSVISSQTCSAYYSLSVPCDECPTTPSGTTALTCWEDNYVTWSYMETNLGSATTYWTTLGYTESMWDSGTTTSAAANLCWSELSSAERSAAISLGYSENLWNYPYRCN